MEFFFPPRNMESFQNGHSHKNISLCSFVCRLIGSTASGPDVRGEILARDKL
jgi:hypothetical protein